MNIYCQLNKKTKIKKKRPGMAHFSDNLLQLPTHTCACKGLRHLSEANFSPCEKNTFYSDLSKRKEGGMINSSPGTNTINPFWPYCNCLKNTAIFDALFQALNGFASVNLHLQDEKCPNPHEQAQICPLENSLTVLRQCIKIVLQFYGSSITAKIVLYY